MRSLKTLLTVLLCLVAVPTLALAEEPARLWEGLSVQGYDSYNATKCYIGNDHETCTYTDDHLTTCYMQVWGTWITYEFRGNRTSSTNYSGELTTTSGGFVTAIKYGNRFSENHGSYVVLQRFYNARNASSTFYPFCEIRRAYGVTFAVRL